MKVRSITNEGNVVLRNLARLQVGKGQELDLAPFMARLTIRNRRIAEEEIKQLVAQKLLKEVDE